MSESETNRKSTRNLADEEVRLKALAQAENYIRVGTNYYYRTFRKTAKGKETPDLQLWKKGIIREDFGQYPEFFGKIRKYSSFVNIPDNESTYRREIENRAGLLPCYNLYEPMEHRPVPGRLDVTSGFLSHIFGKYHEVGMDYLTILQKLPNQNLPGLCLVSKDRKTGKSTFLKWLTAIYGNNAVILGNEDFQGNFNSHWASKLILGIDEGFIEKREVLEKTKRLITDDSILIEAKGRDKVKIDFLGKFILLSNDERNFIPIEKEENRFFVVRVPSITNEDPFLLERLVSEIPAFIHYLGTREIEHQHKSRLWFEPSVYETEALRKVVVSNRSKVEKSMINYLNDVFSHLDETEGESALSASLFLTPKLLATEIQSELKSFAGLSIEIEKVLKDQWALKHTGRNCRRAFYQIRSNDTETRLNSFSTVGKFYEITREFIENLSK